ncbi:RDD family protein [Mycoplasmopsis gallopavonis]|uniref:RDD family protein n=1 Tax=Mycoplasmopsis gallopavonis TaxID=76629 RepID=A0A449AZZ0_9BACT|nr:RDD family protein [Mycoplasmopsis gallopavonis]RIV16406.1 hypothetical protein D1113_02485 [Mycoplasmopsis gallopavonis]VEU73067.1 RDD family protein [Mycoplasmopsis gallopavonis]
MLYQNAKPWKRFGSNFIDLLLSIGGALVLFLVFKREKMLKNEWLFLLPFLLTLIWINFYSLAVPSITNGQTIGNWIFKIKMINQTTKKFSFKGLLLRNIFMSLALSAIIIIFISGIWYNDFENSQFQLITKTTDSKISSTLKFKYNIINPLVKNLTIALINLWLLTNSLGFLFIIVNVKRLSLIDLISGTRIVEKKPIEVELPNLPKLLPYYRPYRPFFVELEIEAEELT